MENEGFYVDFIGKKSFDLVTKSLENRTNGIMLLNSCVVDCTEKATVFIPYDKKEFFIKKIDEYIDDKKLSKKGVPKNNNLISSIESIKKTTIDSLWYGEHSNIPNVDEEWVEVWINYFLKQASFDKEVYKIEKDFVNVCKNIKIECGDSKLLFPESIVKPIKANREKLEMLVNHFPNISEIRIVSTPNLHFLDNSIKYNMEFGEELLSRVQYVNQHDICVRLLDSGIASSHPLLQKWVTLTKTINPSETLLDDLNHGTGMAGVILYNDLKAALLSLQNVDIVHRIDSMKIVGKYSQSIDEKLYGYITKNAVSILEIEDPIKHQILCMAVTSDQSVGEPTSWSSAVDEIIYGENDKNVKRLFFVSAGNTEESELYERGFPIANENHKVEDPAQAWNCVTIGAYTNLYSDDISNDIVASGNMSPFNSTSLLWNRKSPIKPEVLFEGGNLIRDIGSGDKQNSNLSLLTTNVKFHKQYFTDIWGTSAATAQATWFAAQLMNEYPNAWPETIRALLIHSADWTEEMKKTFCTNYKKNSGIRRLLRTCGYGVPNLEKAISCKNNYVNMIIEDEIQPYLKGKFNEMHLHTIPFPSDLLQSMGNVDVKIKITLSYFIEPAPAAKGSRGKYKYASCGLRFDLNNSGESAEDFIKRINIAMRKDDCDNTFGGVGSDRWFLGSNNRDVGSIHSDTISMKAIEVYDCKYIAIYPVSGWWKDRTNLNKFNSKLRYSLIVSLMAEDETIDLYTPIIEMINNTNTILY